MQQPEPDFGRLLRALAHHNVRFVLIGGLAMVAHGSAHVTRDIDLAFVRDKDNVRNLVAALAEFHPKPRGFPDDLPFTWDEHAVRSSTILTLDTDAGIVDLLGEIPETGSFDDLWNRADEFEVFGVRARVASLDDLITMKRTANRPKDQVHVMELEALRKLIREQQQDTSAP